MDAVRRARILVVDDDPSQRGLLTRYLTRAGAQVAMAARALEALARLEAHAVDLLVTDLEMPGESGLWLTARAKDRRPDLPVILVTGAGAVRQELAASRAHPDAVLCKPFPMEDFGGLCARLLAARAAGPPE